MMVCLWFHYQFKSIWKSSRQSATSVADKTILTVAWSVLRAWIWPPTVRTIDARGLDLGSTASFTTCRHYELSYCFEYTISYEIFKLDFIFFFAFQIRFQIYFAWYLHYNKNTWQSSYFLPHDFLLFRMYGLTCPASDPCRRKLWLWISAGGSLRVCGPPCSDALPRR